MPEHAPAPQPPGTLIAHLSDPHLSASRPEKVAALRGAVDHLLGLPLRPDAVVMTGDCTDNGLPGEYALLQELLEPLPVPVYVVPGNHDDRAVMLPLFGPQGDAPLPGFMQYAAEVGPLRLLALDTHQPGAAGGLLDPPRLTWLNDRLAEAPTRPTLIFMHHPPLVCGLSIMDSIGLEGSEALRQLVSRHPQVERVLAGHTHMAQTTRFAHTLLMLCPGLDAGLLPDLAQPHKLVAQRQPPTCLLHHWRADTGLVTYTSVIGQAPLVTLHDGQGWV